jgi:orotidine-5'-phosphate decarboxylase
VLAVTVLTSMDAGELTAVGHTRALGDLVVDLGRMARDAGVPGLVCSPEEVGSLRRALGSEIELVVPGIRPFGAAVGDQKRIATPEQAIAAGADVLVVGRPIRDAADPVAAAVDVLSAIERVS